MSKSSSKQRRARKAGLPPGTLVYTGKARKEAVRIEIIDYDADNIQELVADSVDEVIPFKSSPTVTWLNLVGLHEVDVLERLGKHFNLHPLLMEDVLSTEQRPKLEDFGEHVFLILRALHYDESAKETSTEQVAMVLGPNFVITFQEIPADPFEHVRERLRAGRGRIRTLGPDYLAYALIDAIVDYYFVILETVGENIEELGEEAVSDPTERTLHTIQTLKRELAQLRRSIWPLREVVSALQRGESPLIQDSTGIYLRDVYDHTIQVVETIEAFRDMVSGMFDTYLSSLSNRMNEVMKVLTIIATIFIPVTFVAGVYGMNFTHMPELAFPWAYPTALGVMGAIAVFMLVYFKRKGWI